MYLKGGTDRWIIFAHSDSSSHGFGLARWFIAYIIFMVLISWRGVVLEVSS